MAATNEKLSESEIRYKFLIDSIPDVIGELGLDGTISYISPQIHDLLGYFPDEIVGTNFIKFIHPDDASGIRKAIKKAVKSKEVMFPKLRLKHKKGNYILVFAKGKLIKLGDKARLIGVIRDITKLNETEKKLEESQDIFKQLNDIFLKFKDDPIFNLQLLINTAGLLLNADCALFNILKRVNGKEVLESLVTYNEPPNFTRESDPKGHICTDIIKDNPDDVVIISNLDKTDYIKTDENVRKYDLRQYVSYVVRFNNKPTATFCVVYTKNREMSDTDIIIIQILSKSASTELARWNSRIDSQKSEEKYRRLINNLTDIILELDIKGIVSYVSPQCYNIMGYQPAEIIGKNVMEFIHPDDVMFIAEAMKQVIKTNEILTLRYRIIHKNGGSIYVSANGRYVNIGGNEKFIGVIRDETERKKTETELKESEKKYRSLFENSPIALMDQDFSEMKKYVDYLKASGINDFKKYFDDNHDELLKIMDKTKIVDVNKKTLEVYKTKSKEDYLLRVNQLKENRDNTLTEEAFLYNEMEILSLINGETKYDSEIETQTFKGDTVHLYAKTAIVSGFENTWSKVIVSIINITERKEAEQKLKKSEERLKYLVSSNPAIIYTSKITGAYETTFISDNVVRLWGFESKIFLEHSDFWLDHVHPDDKEVVLSILSELSDKNHIIYEYRFKIRNDTYRWMRDEVFLIRDDRGNPKETIGSVIDITDRKISELKLKESEEKYRNLVEDAQEGVWALDEKENTIFANPKICEMLGYTKNEMMGKNLHLFIPDSMKERIKGNRKKREKGIKETYDLELIKKDGTSIYTNIKAAPIMSESRDYKGSFAYITDITIQKQAEDTLRESEESLKQINIELEKRVEERTTGLIKSERKFKSIFMDSPIGIELYDSNGKLIEANKACCDMFGVTNSRELEGFDLFSDPNIPKSEMEKLKNGKIIQYEAQFDFDKVKQFNLYKTSKSGKSYLDVMITPLYIEDKREISNYLVQVQDITERQNLEAELRNIFNLSLNMIGIAGKDAFFKRINPAVGKTLGYTDEELLGKSFIEFIHPDDVESTLKDVETLSEGKPTVNFVNRFRCKNGTYKWLEWNTKPIPEEEINYFVAQDVTGRKLNEIKLKEYAEKLEFMVEERTHSLKVEMEKSDLYLNLVEVIIVALDRDGKITMLNKKGYSLLEYEEGKLVGKNWFEICLPKQIRKDVFEFFKKLMRREIETTEFYENPILTKSGDEKIISWRNTLLFDNKGEIIGTLGAGVDITERRKAQGKLIESEKKYHALFENTPIGVAISDYKGNTIDINEHMKKLFGYELKELQKLGIATVYANDQDRIPFKKQLEEYGYIQDYEVDLKKKDGNLFPALINSIKTNISGEPIYINTIRDISEKKEIEEIKTHLLKRFSHEFKTPLISIKGFSDLLLSEYKYKLDEKTIGFLERIKKGANRLNVLINAFMESSQLGEKLTNLNKNKENLSDLIKLGVSEMEGLISLRKHAINVDIPEELIGEFDKEKIYTVINNLLMNAINYTPPGGKIFIHSKIEDGDIFFSIQDNGIGLMEEDKRHLFKSFGKIEKYGKGWDIVSEGMGVGLYLSKEIISLHGGKIWAESEGENKGSTFYFSLPII